MNGNYKVPNMGSSTIEQGPTDDRMARITKNLMALNESKKMNESVTTHVCPQCGATFKADDSEDGTKELLCPVCNFNVKDQAYSNESVEKEDEINESADPEKMDEEDEEQKVNESEGEELTEEEEEIKEELEDTLDEYMNLIQDGQYGDAKLLLESMEATAISDGDEIMLEKTKIVIHADGTKTKKKVKTKKKKLKGKRLAAARKNAKKMAKNPNAKKQRKKAMKMRHKKMKNEMVKSYKMTESIMTVFAQNGIDMNRQAVSRMVRESMSRMNESVETEEDKMISTIETVLNNKGIEVLDTDVEVQEDGVVAIEVLVQDTEAEIYLGEVSDEIAETCDCEVDYDEPEPDEDDESVVDLTFYMISREALQESSEDAPMSDIYEEEDQNKVEPTNEKKKKGKKNESEDEEEKEVCSECGKPIDECECGKKNESMRRIVGGMKLNESFNAYAGGTSNVRCKLNPAFIRPGQVVYDADQKTVFKALTESVHAGADFQLTIDVLNSQDPMLAGVNGAEVNITPDGNYYLLKSNPLG